MAIISIEKVLPIFQKYDQSFKIIEVDIYLQNFLKGETKYKTISILTNIDIPKIDVYFVHSGVRPSYLRSQIDLSEVEPDRRLISNLYISSVMPNKIEDVTVIVAHDININDALILVDEYTFKNDHDKICNSLIRNEIKNLFRQESDNKFNEASFKHVERLQSLIASRTRASWVEASNLLRTILK